MNREKQLQLPFSAITGLIEKLRPSDWLKLREWLDEKLAEKEDILMLQNPRIMREIHQALSAYRAGKYTPLKKLRDKPAKKNKQNV